MLRAERRAGLRALEIFPRVSAEAVRHCFSSSPSADVEIPWGVLAPLGRLAERRACAASRSPPPACGLMPLKGSAAPRITVARCRLTPEERKIIEMLERSRGRALTKEEIRLSLEQARAMGEL